MISRLDTIVARSVLVSLIGITLVHLLSLWTYEHALDRELATARETGVAERLTAIARSIMLVPATQRAGAAHDLSGGGIAAHWTASRPAIAEASAPATWQGLTLRIAALTPGIRTDDVVVGAQGDGHANGTRVTMRLPDDSWLDFAVAAADHQHGSGHGTLLSTSLMALGVILLSVLVALWLGRPIRTVAAAVGRSTPGATMAMVPETGPKEVRELAAAFNGMQRRITDLIDRRTRSLAAVSHDLRTPLTRLKLRTEAIDDKAIGRAIGADIGEMEQMIDATLAYLRGDEASEAVRPLDLVALLDTVVDDARDAGHDCTLAAPQRVVIDGRLLGLKRAFANLVGNAVCFGAKVGVAVDLAEDHVLVSIEDDGPGIAEEKLQVVLEPFVRLEESRNRETGGVGLGLTIAKANIEANGGTITLSNRTQGGLRVLATLPLPQRRL